ncbi:type 1 glutamine amidotransferase [Sporolactobacillus putidus]|uniref:type 1 glutamine amidotransferase n=1 Tax=Sporolactobacillus putidus TaxID=492735 RepID=UPI001662C966|nr:glutamine amidotransferase [Sporolactobacillus putidus]
MKSLTLFHFFPDKLNLYGDRGNILTLKKRCEWREISLNVVPINKIDQASDVPLSQADILFIGGGSDREQALCTEELKKIKDSFKSAVEDGTPCLAVCGGYQFLGNYYQMLSGEKLEGLSIVDFYTISKENRLVGDVLMESETFGKLVGFENHAGQTFHPYETLGTVIKGYGNNKKDKKEGLVYKHLIGTYLHGPVLPKNPSIADFLIGNALDRKYGQAKLADLDDSWEHEAAEKVWSRYA